MLMKEIELVKKAILNEVEGYEFYQMAAAKAVEAETKEAFETLAKEEKDHIEWLRGFFEKMKEDDWENYELAVIPNPPSPKIFKWDNLDRKNVGTALSVFSVGMQMEKASVEFYRDSQKETSIAPLIELFEILAKWEEVHYEQFSKEYDRLQKEWWNEQGYAPF